MDIIFLFHYLIILNLKIIPFIIFLFLFECYCYLKPGDQFEIERGYDLKLDHPFPKLSKSPSKHLCLCRQWQKFLMRNSNRGVTSCVEYEKELFAARVKILALNTSACRSEIFLDFSR